MICEEPVCEIVGLPLSFMSINTELIWSGHNSSVADYAMKVGFGCEEALGGADDGGEDEVVEHERLD